MHGLSHAGFRGRDPVCPRVVSGRLVSFRGVHPCHGRLWWGRLGKISITNLVVSRLRSRREISARDATRLPGRLAGGGACESGRAVRPPTSPECRPPHRPWPASSAPALSPSLLSAIHPREHRYTPSLSPSKMAAPKLNKYPIFLPPNADYNKQTIAVPGTERPGETGARCPARPRARNAKC